ncbi:LacI family DNA-binding transcriptional regulator [Glycomyces scopariae]
MTEGPSVRRRPTIREVAHLAGVSHQTVSRYLRSREGLKPGTLERIDAAVRELDYRPNLLARSMRTKRTGRIAVLMPNMVNNPAPMLRGAAGAAHEAGFTVEVTAPEGGAEERTARLLELADSGRVEGILALAPILPAAADRLHGDATVVVSADFDDKMRGLGELSEAAPVYELVQGLAELGHRRLFHVAGDLEFASARARKAAYLDAVERLGLESVGVFAGGYRAETGVEAMRSLTAGRLPTAVIAASDGIAAGVVRGARDRGLEVPRDLSVTGWDDLEIGRFMPPSLTTVHVDLEGLGRRAMIRLVKALSGVELAPSPRPLNQVIWRESTAVARTV